MDVDLESEEDYLVDHSIVLYFVAPNGDFLEFYTQRTEVPEVVERMVKQFKIVEAEEAAKNKK